MMLEQWAYIGEIAAAVAVVASLIYVARQIGQNTAMMRVNASTERVQRDSDIVGSVINSREVAEMFMKGFSELDDLDDTDRQRILLFERRALLHWHNMFGLRRRNLLQDSDWNELTWVIQNFGRRQSVRESWQMFNGCFEKTFQVFIEEQFLIADKAASG